MKTLFLDARYVHEVRLPQSAIQKLPENIALATTIQYLDSIEKIKKDIENSGKKVTLLQGEHSRFRGQILGCDITRKNLPKPDKTNIDGFLFIGDGVFHPKILLFSQEGKKRPVFTYNPKSKKTIQIKETEIKTIEKRYKGALLKFHTSNNIGIIVSTKPGQQRLNKALELKKKIQKKDKKTYVFICNTLDFNELENFNFIDMYVNTMCPRIGYDDVIKFNKPVINYEDIESSL